MTISLNLAQIRKLWLGLLLGGALALTACGGGGSSDPESGSGGVEAGTTADAAAPSSADGAAPQSPATGSVAPPPTGGTAAPPAALSTAAIDAEVKAFLALGNDERQRQARTLSAKVERDWLTLSGLEAELGGAAATDAAYANVVAQFAADRAPSVAPQRRQVRAMAASKRALKADFGETAGGILFASAMEIGLLSGSFLDRSSDAKRGETTSDKTDNLRATISLEKVTYDSSFEHKTSDPAGLVGKLKTHFEVLACPNADGVAILKARSETSMTRAGGTSGQKATLDVSVTVQVNDDAEMVYSDVDTRMEMADFTNSKGAYVDFDLKYSIGTSPRPSSGKVNRIGGKVTDTFTNDAYAMGSIMSLLSVVQLQRNAETAWKSGRCVSLDPTTNPAKRTGLQPSTSVAITAAPRSKIDGGPVGGGVTATLSGEAAVAPASTKVPADASFTYTAANSADKAGNVALEARSKRGVAKAVLAFDTANDGWIGTSSYTDDINRSSAQITWLLVNSANNISMYKATGVGTIASNDGTCSFPETSGPADKFGYGFLFVDFNSTPPTYHGAAATGTWNVTVTCVYPGLTETHVLPAAFLPVFGGNKGPEGVEAAGTVTLNAEGPMTIEGSDTDRQGGVFNWKFTRNR